MPIRSLWNNTDSDDIHVVAGHATTELWNTHAVVNDAAGNHWVQEYQAHHADVRFRFIPRFRGTVTGHVHTGFGIRVNLVTGQVLVDATLPTPRPNNFLLELEAAHLPAGAVLRHRFRIHVHEAYDRIWLTPDKLSIRRQNAAGAEEHLGAGAGTPGLRAGSRVVGRAASFRALAEYVARLLAVTGFRSGLAQVPGRPQVLDPLSGAFTQIRSKTLPDNGRRPGMRRPIRSKNDETGSRPRGRAPAGGSTPAATHSATGRRRGGAARRGAR